MKLPRGAFSYFLLGAVRAQVPAILNELTTVDYENFPVRTLVLGAFWTEWSELHFTGDSGSRIREHEENCKSQFNNFNNDFSKYRICTYPDSNQWQGSIKDGKSWYVGQDVPSYRNVNNKQDEYTIKVNDEPSALSDWRGLQPFLLDVFDEERIDNLASTSPLCDPTVHAIAKVCLEKYWAGDRGCFEAPLSLFDVQAVNNHLCQINDQLDGCGESIDDFDPALNTVANSERKRLAIEATKQALLDNYNSNDVGSSKFTFIDQVDQTNTPIKYTMQGNRRDGFVITSSCPIIYEWSTWDCSCPYATDNQGLPTCSCDAQGNSLRRRMQVCIPGSVLVSISLDGTQNFESVSCNIYQNKAQVCNGIGRGFDLGYDTANPVNAEFSLFSQAEYDQFLLNCSGGKKELDVNGNDICVIVNRYYPFNQDVAIPILQDTCLDVPRAQSTGNIKFEFNLNKQRQQTQQCPSVPQWTAWVEAGCTGDCQAQGRKRFTRRCADSAGNVYQAADYLNNCGCDPETNFVIPDDQNVYPDGYYEEKCAECCPRWHSCTPTPQQGVFGEPNFVAAVTCQLDNDFLPGANFYLPGTISTKCRQQNPDQCGNTLIREDLRCMCKAPESVNWQTAVWGDGNTYDQCPLVIGTDTLQATSRYFGVVDRDCGYECCATWSQWTSWSVCASNEACHNCNTPFVSQNTRTRESSCGCDADNMEERLRRCNVNSEADLLRVQTLPCTEYTCCPEYCLGLFSVCPGGCRNATSVDASGVCSAETIKKEAKFDQCCRKQFVGGNPSTVSQELCDNAGLVVDETRTETATCDEFDFCCKWDDWSAWSECALDNGLSCPRFKEKGRKHRTRNPLCGDKTICGADSFCLEEEPCDIDCNPWSGWSCWSECSKSCGGEGLRSRVRKCTDDLIGSKSCPCSLGDLGQDTVCSANQGVCDISGTSNWLQAVDRNEHSLGDSGFIEVESCGAESTCPFWRTKDVFDRASGYDWSEWGSVGRLGVWVSGRCNSTCGEGFQFRQRECVSVSVTGSIIDFPHEMCEGDAPPASAEDEIERACNLGPCEGCEPWTQWTCPSCFNIGVKSKDIFATRKRTCKDQIEVEEGPSCLDLGLELPEMMCPEWQDWKPARGVRGECSCLTNTFIEERLCTAYDISTGDAMCPGEMERRSPCVPTNCPRLGEWSTWGTCTDETKSRTRTCENASSNENTNSFLCPEDRMSQEVGCDPTRSDQISIMMSVDERPSDEGIKKRVEEALVKEFINKDFSVESFIDKVDVEISKNDAGEYIARLNYEYFEPEDDDMTKMLMSALEKISKSSLEGYEEPVDVNPMSGASFSRVCFSILAAVLAFTLL